MSGAPAAGPDPPDARGREPDRRGRLARWLFPDGNEPDPRFTLANERTFLAWIRTSLALLAGGIAIEAFVDTGADPAVRKAGAVTLLVFGVLVANASFVHWVGVERAIRRDRPLPVPVFGPLLVVAGTLGVVLVIAVIL